MTTMMPDSNVYFLPKRSERMATNGKTATEPMDWAAVTRPSLAPEGSPK